jgi:hypothetical protein
LGLLFRLLPGLLTEIGILEGMIKMGGQRALAFFFAGDACPVRDHRHLGQEEALLSPFVGCHGNTCFSFFLLCAKKAVRF